MAVGNTFGATALSSYGGFWISFAIVLTPGGFAIADAYTAAGDFDYAFGFFLFGWFIFTTILLICTLRSTVAFFLLFFFLDMAFLLLAIGYITGGGAATNVPVIKAGGYFAIFAAFMAWYNALAGIADSRYVRDSQERRQSANLQSATPFSSSQSLTSHGPRRHVSVVRVLPSPTLCLRFKWEMRVLRFGYLYLRSLILQGHVG